MRNRHIAITRMVFCTVLHLLLRTAGGAQSGIRGYIHPHSGWAPQIYIARLTDPDHVFWEDSLRLGSEGYFEYLFTPAQKRDRLLRLAIVPVGYCPSSFMEGNSENTVTLVVPDSGWIELEAKAEQFYFSFKLQAAPNCEQLMLIRDFKLPFRDLISQSSYIPSNADTLVDNSKAVASLDSVIKQYQASLRMLLEEQCDSYLLLAGLYYYYLSDRGRLDPVFFDAALSRINATAVPLYQSFMRLHAIATLQSGLYILPDLPFVDASGDTVTLGVIRASYYLLDLWASWCSPCRQAITMVLPSLHRKYRSAGLAIVGISLDKFDQKWKRALKEDQPDWPQWRELPGAPSLSACFGIHAIPHYLIADGNHRVLFSSGVISEVDLFLQSRLDKTKTAD